MGSITVATLLAFVTRVLASEPAANRPGEARDWAARLTKLSVNGASSLRKVPLYNPDLELSELPINAFKTHVYIGDGIGTTMKMIDEDSAQKTSDKSADKLLDKSEKMFDR